MNTECNADYDHVCDAGPDGERCDDCQRDYDANRAYFGTMWVKASPEERDPDRYRREMREAGRGHLVRDEVSL